MAIFNQFLLRQACSSEFSFYEVALTTDSNIVEARFEHVQVYEESKSIGFALMCPK
jgi:hypothetical protein